MATSKNYGKKKGSDHFRDILNPYGEKSNYGKIGRRRRLSKLNVLFFSIILSVTIYHIYLYTYIIYTYNTIIHYSSSLTIIEHHWSWLFMIDTVMITIIITVMIINIITIMIRNIIKHIIRIMIIALVVVVIIIITIITIIIITIIIIPNCDYPPYQPPQIKENPAQRAWNSHQPLSSATSVQRKIRCHLVATWSRCCLGFRIIGSVDFCRQRKPTGCFQVPSGYVKIAIENGHL